jgi:hypothetical protein
MFGIEVAFAPKGRNMIAQGNALGGNGTTRRGVEVFVFCPEGAKHDRNVVRSVLFVFMP